MSYGQIPVNNDILLRRIASLEKKVEEFADKIEKLELELKCTDSRINRLVYGDDY